MPFVRFSRDRRGYENVYLVDAPAERGVAGRPRVLYWYRTPPGVKVGRAPFDPATQRAIEARNPGIAFDWSQIVAAKIPPAVPVEGWRERRRIERAVKRARLEDTAGQVEGEVEAESGGEEQPDAPALASPPQPSGGQPPPAGAQQPGSVRRRRRRTRRRRQAAAEAAPNGGLDPVSDGPESSNED